MKKTACLLVALTLSSGLLLADGRLTSVSVSENGTVMLTTGSPSEFKSSWTGQLGNFKMQIELPGVTVDKTAKVLGNLAANRGIKSVRFSQFKNEPPVARVVIESPERLSYSWSTKPEGVELHFMLPSPVTTTTGTAPATTGFAVPSSVFSQSTEEGPPTAAGKRLTPPPASSARQATETTAAQKGEKAVAKVSIPPSQTGGAKTGLTAINGKSSTVTKITDTVKPGAVAVGTPSTGTTDKKPLATGTVKPAVTPPTSMTVGPPAPGKSVVTVKAPTSGQQKDSVPTGAISTQQEKTGTTTPAKSTPSVGPPLTPASGGTGVVIKPSSPIPGQPAPTASAPVPAENPKITTAGPTVPGPSAVPSAAKTMTGTPAAPVAPLAIAKTAGPAPAASSKPTGTTTVAKPLTTGAGTTKPTVGGITTDTADQEKFREELKKALGKLETPAKPADAKLAETGQKEVAPTGKPDETSFQEQLKRALDPAKSLTDTSEVADVDDIDTDLPATDEEEENPYDTTFAFPGGTFMQVSPSRKVIRYHSEGRRDPFSPLTGRDRYASGKKRRAVPAAEQLRLVGIMRSLAGNKALLEDGEGNGYILAPGDRVRNGYLVSVSENKVLFQVTEYGWTKTVAMELGTLE